MDKYELLIYRATITGAYLCIVIALIALGVVIGYEL